MLCTSDQKFVEDDDEDEGDEDDDEVDFLAECREWTNAFIRFTSG
jgi:hypothetical protein